MDDATKAKIKNAVKVMRERKVPETEIGELVRGYMDQY
jgi:hypothetical protein